MGSRCGKHPNTGGSILCSSWSIIRSWPRYRSITAILPPLGPTTDNSVYSPHPSPRMAYLVSPTGMCFFVIRPPYLFSLPRFLLSSLPLPTIIFVPASGLSEWAQSSWYGLHQNPVAVHHPRLAQDPVGLCPKTGSSLHGRPRHDPAAQADQEPEWV